MHVSRCLQETFWGSYVTDTSDGVTARTLWDAAITRYADIAIQSVGCIAGIVT